MGVATNEKKVKENRLEDLGMCKDEVLAVDRNLKLKVFEGKEVIWVEAKRI